MAERIVITGVGILSSNAKGREDYWNALKEGRVGHKKITLFDTSELKCDQAGEISDFDPTVYMGKKGLRSLDRSTKLLVSASKLAVADSGLEITEENSDDIGVAVGSTMGSVKSISDFDEVTLREGPRYTNPALFPNTVINSPASQVNIWNYIQGFSCTISTGFTASIDAISYGCDFILYDRVKMVYAGGIEEMCFQTYFGFHVLKYHSGSKDREPFINCPFDRRRNGITFGEGGGLICVEELEHAKARNARIYAEVAGFGYSFDPFRIHKFNPRATGLKRAIRFALEDAEMEPEDIDYICANANSSVMADKFETVAIKEVFGKRAKKIPVSAIKSMVGEGFSVSGAFALAAATGAIYENFIPPTVNYKEKDPDCDLDVVPNKSRKAKLNNVLIITAGPNGSNSCMIIKRYKP